MNAENVMRLAQKAGISISIEGEKLKLSTPGELPEHIVNLLAGHKFAILEMLQTDSRQHGRQPVGDRPHRKIMESITRPDDFRRLTDEAGEWWRMIVFGSMRDAGRSRADAEAVAWEDVERATEGGGNVRRN